MMTKLSPNSKHIQYPPLYARNFATISKRLVILGKSTSGDLYSPTLVVNVQMARELFGSGAIISAYEDVCTYNKNILVYLMRIEDYSYEYAFSVLNVFDFDLIYMDDVFFDKDRNLINAFLDFAKGKEEKGNLIHGIIMLSENRDFKDNEFALKDISLLSEENGDEPIERGKYLSVVYNQGEFKSASAVYAGILAYIEPEVSPINKTIQNFTLLNELSKEEINSLKSIGVVCFRDTFKKGITCASSSCAVSTEGSVHKHISNFRIAQFLINKLSESLREFIGKPHLAFQVSKIEDTVEAIYSKAIKENRIKEFDYSISTNRLKGVIRLEIQCVPIFSVYAIATHTQVRVFS